MATCFECRKIRARTCLLVPVILLLGSTTAIRADELPRAVKQKLTDVVLPAMLAGEDQLFFTEFAAIIERANDERMQAVEAFAEANQIPSPAEHFVDLKLMRIEQQVDPLGGNQHLGQTMFLIGRLNGRLEEFLGKVRSHDSMRDPPAVPEDWKKSRDMFWDAHVFKNEFDNYRRLIDYGAASLMPLHKRILNSDKSQVLETAQRFEQLAGELPIVEHELHEREAELRLIRFERSLEQLLESGSDFETKLLAAMSVELDSEILVPLLRQHAGSLTRQQLLQPGLANYIETSVADARKHEPDVTTKARLFREGMHWWLRGRYGLGPLAHGLLKPVAAMDNEFAMNALYMPRVRPQPIRPANSAGEGAGERGYDRRHYYTWAVEYRPLITQRSRERLSTEVTNREVLRSSEQIRRDSFFF